MYRVIMQGVAWMKTIEITETDLYELVHQVIGDEIVLLNNGRQVARLLPPRGGAQLPSSPTTRQSSTSPSSTSATASQFIVASDGDAMEEEIAAYEELHPELVSEHLGQYVAIYEGRVVDFDNDRLALRQRIHETYPNEVVLVRQVKPTLPAPLHIRSPRLRRTL